MPFLRIPVQSGLGAFGQDRPAARHWDHAGNSQSQAGRQGCPGLSGLVFGIRSEVADEMRLLREWLDFHPINYIIGLTFVHIGLFFILCKSESRQERWTMLFLRSMGRGSVKF